MYQRIYDRGTNSAADPEAMSLEPTYKPTKKKATPIKKATNRYIANREIKSVTILEDGKRPIKIESLTSGYLFSATEDSARYQIQCRLVYYED